MLCHPLLKEVVDALASTDQFPWWHFGLTEEVLPERSGVDQFLGDGSSNGKHGKTSVLKLLQRVVSELLRRGLHIQTVLENTGVVTDPRLSLEEAEGLKDGDDADGQCNPDGIGVEHLEGSPRGSEEVVPKGTARGVTLGDQEADDGELSEPAVHDLALAVAGQLPM